MHWTQAIQDFSNYLKLERGLSNNSISSLLINSIVKTEDEKFIVGTNQGLMTFDPYNSTLQLTKFDLNDKYDRDTSIFHFVLNQ